MRTALRKRGNIKMLRKGGDEMIEKRVAISNTVLRLEMLINVLSDDLDLFEKVGERGGFLFRV